MTAKFNAPKKPEIIQEENKKQAEKPVEITPQES